MANIFLSHSPPLWQKHSNSYRQHIHCLASCLSIVHLCVADLGLTSTGWQPRHLWGGPGPTVVEAWQAQGLSRSA